MPAARPKCSTGQIAGPGRLGLLLLVPPVAAAMLFVALPTPGRAAVRSEQAVVTQSPVEAPAAPTSPARSDTGETVRLDGVVFDSVTMRPLAGAEVQVVDLANREQRAYTVRTDSLGHFNIAAIPPGRYAAGFFHSAVDALGIESPLQAVIVRPGTDNFATLAIPGPRRIMNALCGNRSEADSSGGMAGVVRDARTGMTMRGVQVVVTWRDLVADKQGLAGVNHREPTETGGDGSYHVCGLPGSDTVLARAEEADVHTGTVQIAIPPRGIVRQDFTVGDSSNVAVIPTDSGPDHNVENVAVMRGAARLTGVVRSDDGIPVSGARVLVWGTGIEAVTDSDGRYHMTGLPSGTFSLEARAIGFPPRFVPIDLSSRTPATVNVKFEAHIQHLARVVVQAKQMYVATDILNFLARSHSGIGHFLTEQDRGLRMASDVTEALRRIPGLQIISNGFGHIVLMRGRCAPVVYVDGTEAIGAYRTLDDIVLPSQVVGIEIYTGLGEAPPQYKTNGCGVLLVWTKRGM